VPDLSTERHFIKLLQVGFSYDQLIFKGSIDFISSNLGNIEVTSLAEMIFTKIGQALFFSFALIGCLYVFSKKYVKMNARIWVCIAFIPLGLFLLSLVMHLMIYQDRIIVYSELMLTIPLALSIFILTTILKKNFLKPLFFSVFIIGLTFFMMISPGANIDNNHYSPTTTVRYAFTNSEVISFKFIPNYYTGPIATDSLYATDIGHYYYSVDVNNQITNQFENALIEKDFNSLSDKIIVLREYLNNNPYFSHQGVIKLNYSPKRVFENGFYDKLYTSNSIGIYKLNLIT